MTAIGSGALTQQLYQKLFDRLDVDSSQDLDLHELKTADPSRADNAFSTLLQGLDADEDGKISRAEMAASPSSSGNLPIGSGAEAVAGLFARADVDGDGLLSDQEMEAEKALRRADSLDSGFRSGPVFLHRDANGDGLRSPDEMMAALPLALPAGALKPRLLDDVSPAPLTPWNQIRGGAAIAPPKAHTAEERQRFLDQWEADRAERASGPAGTVKYLSRELGGLRDEAAKDFAARPMTQALSSRLLAQILGGLDAEAAA